VITILCSGTRGDVQPYLALALELLKLGKPVRIVSNKNFESFVRGYGVDFYPINADYQSANVDPAMIRQAQQADNPLKMLLTFRKMKEYGAPMLEDFFSACEGSQVIVYHPGIAIGYFAAERLGIPAVLASPFPLHSTRQHTSVILYGKVKANPIVNRLSYRLLQSMLWMTSKSTIQSFWRKKFGQLPAHFGSPYERHTDARHPAVISCSNHIFKRPADWNANIHQDGYWFLDESDDYTPSPDLAAFLAKGDQPIYVGFGSMFDPERTEALTKIILEGLARTGQRAILGGFGKLEHLPETVFAVESIPYSWLFERVSAVCHHGGAGTSAEGFRAGVPSAIFPFALDQYAWAQRAFDLGVGSRPVPIKQLTAEKFSDAIQYISQDQIRTNAARLGEKIRAENGAAASARVIASCK
jgi:sterol 3beta-glucosyltransferase